MKTLVTGGSGYIGALLVSELREAGHEVRVLDSLLHGQEDIAAEQEQAGVEVMRGDIRDADARAAGARRRRGRRAPRRDRRRPRLRAGPAGLRRGQREGHRGARRRRQRRRRQRLVFASTCSNYGRMADPTVPITEEGELRPVSLYAEQKVGMEKLILGGAGNGIKPTCLRFATVYGVGRRMRFDLTVNEFTRELWADRELEVFGEQFWRPYIHVRDAGRAVRTVLEAPVEKVARQRLQRRPLGRELPQARHRRGDRQADRQGQGLLRQEGRGPARLQGELRQDQGRARLRDADDGARRDRRDHAALDEGRFGDPYDPRYKNIP